MSKVVKMSKVVWSVESRPRELTVFLKTQKSSSKTFDVDPWLRNTCMQMNYLKQSSNIFKLSKKYQKKYWHVTSKIISFPVLQKIFLYFFFMFVIHVLKHFVIPKESRKRIFQTKLANAMKTKKVI